MTEPMTPWPASAPAHGSVRLRQFEDRDVHLALELGSDPYIPLIGSLPAHPTTEQAQDWIRRQRARRTDGVGLSFAVVDATSDAAVGTIGLWLSHVAQGRAAIGYSVSPHHRRRGVAGSALTALTALAWTDPRLHRLELYIEPDNDASIGVATAGGYRREGLLRSHQEIGGVRRDMLLYATIRTDHTTV